MSDQKELHYEKGDQIFSEDTNPEGVYIVKDGLVEIYRTLETTAGFKDIELDRVGPRGMFGEMGLIDQQPRSASARALSPTTLLFISRSDFKKHLDQLPPWVSILIRSFVHRLRDANERLVKTLESGPDAANLKLQAHEVVLDPGDSDSNDVDQLIDELEK
ncbi:MAG: cyclic nucleotide-binding domain-containing protein [Verrucomicrobiota bacterium]